MKPLDIDLALLCPAKAPQVFKQVDPDLRRRLEALPEVLDRVDGCVHFCALTNSEAAGAESADASAARARQKYLRASLCEFGSIGDAAKLDFGVACRRPPGIRQLRSPQVHVVRLLRHANVHLAASKLAHKSRAAVWPSPDGDVEFDHTQYIIVNLEATVCKTKRSSDYSDAALSRMLAWLDREQREWGIANVVHRTAEVYGSVLADSWEER